MWRPRLAPAVLSECPKASLRSGLPIGWRSALNKRYATLTLIALALVAAGAAHAQSLIINPSPVNLFAQAGGGSVQTSVSFTSSDNGATSIQFTLVPSTSWISVSAPPQGGNTYHTPVNVVVTVTPSQFPSGASGTLTGSLSVFGATFTSVQVNVTVSSISVFPTSLNLGTYQAGSSVYPRSEEHTSELQSLRHLVCRL